MNDRFKIPDDKPKRKQELPKSKQAKCALAYSILVENMMADGIPHDAADAMATDVITTFLETMAIEEEANRLMYNIYSTVYNN